MGDLVRNNDQRKSQKYYKEAAIIALNCDPSDRETASECFNCMAVLYENSNMREYAIKCRLTTLKIKYQMLFSDHIDIAWEFYMLGFCYEEMKNRLEALHYFNKSFYLSN